MLLFNSIISEVPELKNPIDFTTFFNKDKYLNKKYTSLSKCLFKIAFNSDIQNNNYYDLFKECKQKGIKYVDREFPTNLSSLIKENPDAAKNQKWKKIEWVRASDYLKEYTLFPEIVTPKGIYQGALNNNTFISVLSALAEKPEIIKKIFLTDKINECGIYGVNLCIDGKLSQCIVDDYIPCDNKLHCECFSHGEKNTIWVQILEKCYAKKYNSYSNIGIKDIDKIVKDLTCAPVITLDNSLPDLFNYIIDAQKHNWLVFGTPGDTESSKELLKEIGLIPSHVYSIVNIYQIDDNIPYPKNFNEIKEEILDEANKNTLLQIRNYLSKDGWFGDWSDGSDIWTVEMQKKVDYNKNKDSCFYITLKDFNHYFSKIKICKIFNNFNYEYISVMQKVDSYSLVKISIKDNETVHGFINLLQTKNKKAFPNMEYGIIRMIICKLEKFDLESKKYEVVYIVGKMGQEREIFEERNFEPGDYLIFTELNKNLVDSETVLSFYSSGQAEFTLMNNEDFPEILEKIYISSALKQQKKFTFEDDGAPNCKKYSNKLPEGYIYIYIENDEKDITLIESVNYTKFEGLKLLPPFKGTSYKVEVGPGKRKIVLIKQLNITGYNLIFSYNSTFNYGEESLLKIIKKKGLKRKRKVQTINVDLDGLNVYVFQYPLGLCYYYENNSDRTLKETLTLTDIVGIEVIGDIDDENKIHIVLGPNKTKLIHLKAKQNNWSVKAQISYVVN